MRVSRTSSPKAPSIDSLGQWKLEDAKARFSEVVRLATSEGPQLVTVRGKEAAIILDPATYRRLLPQPADHIPVAEFLQTLDLSGIDLEREVEQEEDIDRELAL
jgi:prevent-host-death family protein